MSSATVADIVNAVEAAAPVDTWAQDGVAVWPFVRADLAHRLWRRGEPARTNEVASTASVSAAVDTLARVFSVPFRDRAHHARLTPAPVLLVSQASSRFKVGEVWLDTYCDPIVDALRERGIDSLVVEMPVRGEIRTPRGGPSRFVEHEMTLARVAGAALARVAPEPAPFPGQETAMRVLDERVPGVSLQSPRAVLRTTKRVNALRRYWGWVLDRVRPRLVFGIAYYCEEGWSLDLACRDRGIPVVDLQHGVQGTTHQAYGRWTRVPRRGFATMPDVFWNWDESSARAIRDWAEAAAAPQRAMVGGHPWLAFWERATRPEIAATLARIGETRRALGDGPHVLWTLQPRDPELIRQSIAASPPHWVHWLRLHNAMWGERERYLELARSLTGHRVVVDEASQVPLPALLRQVDVHATAWSSCVLEATALGVPSVAIHPMAEGLFPDAEAQGALTLAYEPQAIVAAIAAAAQKKLARGLSSSHGEALERTLDHLLAEAGISPEAAR